MRKLLIFCIAVFSASLLYAQSWNPYVSQGIINPAPLLPLQLNGTGVISFNIGNTGSDPLLYYPAIPANNLKLVITLSRGLPDVTPLNPATALTTLGGTWAALFTWTYDMGQNAFTGTQNQAIQGLSQGSVTIQYKVSQNSVLASPLNGFNVILTPPPYTNGINSTSDDAVSSYTWTEARDYGDAPISYGSADHIIDFDNNYRYFGSLIDHDTAYLASATANGDDITGTDDEDGVTFPTLIQGYPAVIPISYTGVYGFLNAWIDWNGDGDFADAVEQIASNVFLGNGIYNLTIAVPANAFASAPTFARFRVGLPTGSTGSATWGEVEDYQVTINPFTIAGTIFDDGNGMTNNFVDGTGTNANGGIFINLVLNSNNQVLASLPVNSNGTYSFGVANGVVANTNYNLIVTAAAQTPGNTLATATFPANWVPTGEIQGTGAGNDGTVDGKLAVNTNSGNVTNARFGLDQLPETDNITGSLTNPGGSNQVPIPTLTGTDPEDGTLGGGNTLAITSLATNGILYYNGIAILLNQVITNYNPGSLTLDPVDGVPVVTFGFAFIDAAGKQDPTPAVATFTFSDLTLSGNVFDDANGMNNAYVDGTGTNATGNIYMNLVNGSSSQVIASLLVSNNGTYSFGTSDGVVGNTAYKLILSTTYQTPGNTLTTASFPANWVPTGENIGTGAGNDGTVDGILIVVTSLESIANANFGVDQLPDSDNATATYTNPGGTNQVIVPTLSGSDPEDGSLGVGSTFVITMPATNGTLYYNGTAVIINQVITNYDPAFFAVDPDDGEPVVTFEFAFIDAAGKQDPTPAAATLTFSDLTVAGTVFDDGNGMNNTFVDGTGTNASENIFVNLVNTGSQVVASAPANSYGTYGFGTSDGILTGTDYFMIITSDIQSPGNILTIATFPVNWVPTGENLGTGAGNDGTVDGILAVNTNSGNVSDANFGLDQLPNSNEISGTRLNPGGTIQVIVPTLSGSDAEDGPLGSGDTFVITEVATNGTLYYNGLVVIANQVITSYNPALLTIDPIDGTPVVNFSFACVDAAGKQDPTPGMLTITFTLVPYADLSVTKTDGSGIFTTGSNIVYTIVAGNGWNDDAIAASVTDIAPYGTIITGWSAIFSPGATGLSNGTGNIDEVVSIPAGGMITYTVTVSVPCYFTENLINTATIGVPEGVTDPDPSNNSSTDTDIQNIWTGAVSDDWNVDANWSIGIPGCSKAVSAIIPADPYMQYPVIYDTGMSAANLVIAFGATLTINPGKDLDVCGCTVFSGPDALYLRSDGTNGNASFMTSQTGSVSYPNNGSAKVELFLNACLYSLECSFEISSPLTNALSGVFAGDSLNTYNEVTGSFSPFITSTTEPLNPMQGYFLSNSGVEIRTFHGKLNDSTITKSLTSTQGAGEGWNLAGNPYPSEIDLSTTLDWINLDKVIYYYDHIAGNYKPYPFAVGFGLGSQYIPSMQGFFVHVNSETSPGILKFTDDNRTTTGNVNFYKDLPVDLLWLTVSGNTEMNDEVIVYFRSDVSGGYDQDIDCFKLNGAFTAPQLCAVSADNNKLTIDALPFTGDHTIVPLEFNVASNATGNYSLTASRFESFSSGTRITLEDKKLDSSQLLVTHPVYNFTYTTGDDPARFLLHFYGPFYGINDKGKYDDLQIYSFGHDVYVKDLTGSPEKGEFFLYDLMGKKITQKPVEGISLNKYTFNLPNGYYLVRVVTNDKTYNGKVYLD